MINKHDKRNLALQEYPNTHLKCSKQDIFNNISTYMYILYVWYYMYIPYMYHTLSIPFPPPHWCPHLGQPWRWPNFLAPVRAWLVELGSTSLGMLKIMNKKHGGFNQYITYITNINWLYIYLGTYVIIHNQLFIGELKIGLMQNNNQQNQQTPQLDLSCFRTTGRVMLCTSNLNWLNFNTPLCLCRD